MTNNEEVLRSCEHNWLDPDYKYPWQDKTHERMIKLVGCEICREEQLPEDCIEYLGHYICLECCESILDIYSQLWRKE